MRTFAYVRPAGVEEAAAALSKPAARAMGGGTDLLTQQDRGILQGIGFALSEERVVDPTTGTVVNAGLEDYKIPTLADLPEVECRFVGEPDPELALGIKGLGEPPIIPTPGAIGNAVAHALRLRLREAPYTPRRVLEALQ